MGKTVETEIRVRFGECDYYQHVNNTVYLTYTDVALSDYLRSIWPDLMQLPYMFHYVHVSLDFKSPATFEDILLIKTRVTNIGETSVTFTHTITNKKTGALILESKKVSVVLDIKTGKKCNVPEQLKAGLI